MSMTTGAAAEQLGVNQSRARALIASGGLTGRRVGGRWLLDPESVERLAALKAADATGRPMAQRIGWAAANLAEGGAADWLGANERSRLKVRLDHVAAEATPTLQRWLERRSNAVARYRVGASDGDALLATKDVVRTGVSAAAAYRLDLGTGGEAAAYVTEDVRERLVEEFFLIPTESGNLTLRVMTDDFHLVTAQSIHREFTAPRLIVGADLADDIDVRSRSAGRALIEAALREKAWR